MDWCPTEFTESPHSWSAELIVRYFLWTFEPLVIMAKIEVMQKYLKF
jgi:hypothetical protein